MTEPNYSVKEILELQYKNLDIKLDDIRSTLKEQNIRVDKQFLRLDGEIVRLEAKVTLLEQEIAKYKVIWGIGATVGGGLIAFFLNRIF